MFHYSPRVQVSSRAAVQHERAKRERTRNFINSGKFHGVRTTVKLLTQVCNLIIAYQDYNRPISEVFESFYDLRDAISKINGLLSEGLQAAQYPIDHFWDLLKIPCHLFSNVRYIGRKMDIIERSMVIEQLLS